MAPQHDEYKISLLPDNELRPREWLLHCRALWAARANMALRLAGHEARIGHRTLEAQGIGRVPTTHLLEWILLFCVSRRQFFLLRRPT